LDRTGMSSKELKRLGVLARVEKETLNLVNAAEILGLSYRQAKRIWRRYQEGGAEGLQHRSVGRESGLALASVFGLSCNFRAHHGERVGERSTGPGT
jgi:transposase